MGIFDKMKSMVGIGNPTLKLDLDPPIFVDGEPMNGSILIAAQERPTRVQKITIQLVCDIETARADGTTTTQRIELGESVIPFDGDGFQLTANAKRRLPFELTPRAMEVPPSAAYRLIASADCPGLDPTTTLVVSRHERAAEPAAPELEPLRLDGLLAIRSIFVPEVAKHAGDTTLLVPRFEKEAYEPTHVFRKPEIDAALIAAMCGRVVFLTGWTASFGVLIAVPDSTEFAVLTVQAGCTGASFCGLGDIREVSLARFVGAVGEPLTYAALYTGQKDYAQGLSVETFAAHIAELRQVHPGAVL